jgi:hypothetical protein
MLIGFFIGTYKEESFSNKFAIDGNQDLYGSLQISTDQNKNFVNIKEKKNSNTKPSEINKIDSDKEKDEPLFEQKCLNKVCFK